MDWTLLWTRLFGTTQLLGVDMGFWVAMAITAAIVAVMNIVCWGIRPKSCRKPRAF